MFQALKEEKIIYGIDTDFIHNIIKNEQFDESIDVAFGIPSEDGKDGYVKLLFLTKRNLAPKEDEKGNVDFKEIQLIQNVKKDDRLAETIPPVPGKEGKTVFNETVLPEVGKAAKLPAGPNTNVSPDNPNILVSSIDGNVILKGGSVSVDSVCIVPTSVDFQTGNDG